MLCEVNGCYKVSGKVLLEILATKGADEALVTAIARSLRRPVEGVRLVGAEKPNVSRVIVGSTAKKSCVEPRDGQWIPCIRCWRNIIREVFRNRGRFCHVCGSTDGITGHHIVPRSEGGDHYWTNIVPLCCPCHDFVEMHEKRPRTLDAVISVGLERLA